MPQEQDSTIVFHGQLPHGFQKVQLRDSEAAYLNLWINRQGRDFYPFFSRGTSPRDACWVNSRRFAICARSPQQCCPLAELMHSYNILANRAEVFTVTGEASQ